MERCTSKRAFAGIVAGLALIGAGAAPTPAGAVENLYTVESSVAGLSTLVPYRVDPPATLTALTPEVLRSTPRDVAITPDGRFLYVTIATDTIARFSRIGGGQIAPDPGGVTVPSGSDPRGILVDPSGARVYYANFADATVAWRSIGADGTLGPAATVFVGIPGVATGAPEHLAMTPDGRSLYVADPRGARLWQFDVDPLTGAATPKSAPLVAWPGAPPRDLGRLTVAPNGRQLYVPAEAPADAGIARYDIDAGGSLTAATLEATAPSVGAGQTVAPIAPGGRALWATGAAAGARINPFAVQAGGALAPIASPPTASANATRDASTDPAGGWLFLGQDGSVGIWRIEPDGTVTAAADAAPAPGVANAGLVLAPSQAPVAQFTVAPRPAGQPTSFDATASADPDGSIARYDWDFGDGAAGSGPAPAHVYTSQGARTVTLVVTDADGTSTARLWTGARLLRNGGPSARRSQLVQVPPAAGPAAPRPRKGTSVTAVAERGTILVRLPGTARYVRLQTLSEIPLGSIVDARKGRVRITSEVDAATGRTQSAVFYDWFFRVLQTRGAKPITIAQLVKGSFLPCGPARRRARTSASAARGSGLVANAAAKKRKRSRKKVRRLWGKGDGSFRTTGKRSSATVRGTWWLVEDRCDGTLTRVKQGRVDVRDFRLRKTFKLRPGRRSQYLAKAP